MVHSLLQPVHEHPIRTEPVNHRKGIPMNAREMSRLAREQFWSYGEQGTDNTDEICDTLGITDDNDRELFHRYYEQAAFRVHRFLRVGA